jgi:hypothetical protein
MSGTIGHYTSEQWWPLSPRRTCVPQTVTAGFVPRTTLMTLPRHINNGMSILYTEPRLHQIRRQRQRSKGFGRATPCRWAKKRCTSRYVSSSSNPVIPRYEARTGRGVGAPSSRQPVRRHNWSKPKGRACRQKPRNLAVFRRFRWNRGGLQRPGDGQVPIPRRCRRFVSEGRETKTYNLWGRKGVRKGVWWWTFGTGPSRHCRKMALLGLLQSENQQHQTFTYYT